MKAIYILAIAAIALQSCSMSKDDSSGDITTGEGGSLARFTIVNDHLYIVGESNLSSYSLPADGSAPVRQNTLELSFGAETVFPYDFTHLLLGTQDGMYVIDISDPSQPQKKTLFQHIRSCDPVVAENGYAYITLNANSMRCWRGLNEMQIVDIHNLSDPYLVKSYTMGSPQGLDIHNDTLFVCDGGLKMLDVKNKNNPYELAYFPEVQPTDVIYTQGRLLLIGSDGFNQYSIGSNNITKISSLPIEP